MQSNGQRFVLRENVPASLNEYTVVIEDACLNSAQATFNTCAQCNEPIYDSSSDVHTYTFGTEGLIFRVTRPCNFKEWGFTSSEIRLGDGKNKFTNIPDGLKYTIIWPRGRNTVIENKTGSGSGTEISGAKEFDLDKEDYNGEPLIIKIIRSDGCERDLTLFFGNKVENVMVANRGHNNDWAPHKYVIQSSFCKASCNINVQSNPNSGTSSYVNDCDFNDLISFKYKPSNQNDPCGGGEIKAIFIENGKPVSKSWQVPQSAFEKNERYFITDINDPLRDQVMIGGGCVFYPQPIVGQSLGRSIYVNWYTVKKEDNVGPADYVGCPELDVSGGPEEYTVHTSTQYLNTLTITYPDGSTKSILTSGNRTYKIKNTSFGGVIKFYLGGYLPCPPAEEVRDVDKINCGITALYERTGDILNLNLSVPSNVELGKFTITFTDQEDGTIKLYKDDNGNSNFVMEHGARDYAIQLNTPWFSLLSGRKYKINIVFDNGCEDVVIKDFTKAGIIDGPPIYFNCSSNIQSISFSHFNNEYVVTYKNTVGDKSTLIVSSAGNINALDFPTPKFEVNDFEGDVMGSDIDAKGECHLLVEDNGLEITSASTNFNQTTSLDYLSNGKIFSKGDNKIIFGVDGNNNYVANTYSSTNSLVSTELLIENLTEFQLVLPIDSIVLVKSNIDSVYLMNTKTGAKRSLNIDKNIKIVDIKKSKEGRLLLLSEFNHDIEIDNKIIENYGFQNGIITVLDREGTILSNTPLYTDRKEYIKGFTPGSDESGLYYGTYSDTISYSDIPSEVIVDSCSFIKKFVYDPKIECDTTMIEPYLDQNDCVLFIVNPNQLNLSIQFKESNNTWTNLATISESYQPAVNGTYRVLASKDGCNDVYSDEIVIDCATDICDEVSIDITYSEHTGKFCSFYNRFVTDTKMYSSWIEPSTQITIDSFLSITLSEIDVHSVRFGGTRYIYIVGADKMDLHRTKTIKFDYITRQVIWETWQENFQIVDVMEYATSDTLFNLGYSYPGQLWWLKGYNVLTGQEVYSQPWTWKTGVTKLFSECSGIKVKTKNLYAYVPNTAPEIVYVSPISKWSKPLPPVMTVRDIVITKSKQIVVGGDFNGTIVINDSTYVADTLRTGFFITYDSTGQIIKVNMVKKTKHFVLHKMTTDGYGMIGYIGYTLTSGGGSSQNFTIIEAIIGDEGVCVEVGGFSLATGNGNGSGIGFRALPVVEQPHYFPNPFTNSINVSFISSTDTEANLYVFDSYGQIIFTENVSVQTGRNNIAISQFERVPPGVYIVKCKVANQEFTNRVIKLQ